MKQMKLFKPIVCVVCIATFLVSCSKDGDQGPVGPQGEQGVAGPEGPQGEPGPVEYYTSSWINTELKSDFGDDISASFTIEAPELTTKVIETGLVLMFGRREDGLGNQFVESLPVIINSAYNFRFQQRVGEITIVVSVVLQADGLHQNGALIQDYRYVIIPNPGGDTSGKNSQAVDYTKMSYEELAAYLNF